jgi:sialidase-1
MKIHPLSLLLAMHSFSVDAAEPPTGPLHAWYREDSVRAAGPVVSAWENAASSGAAKDLTRVVGRPRAVRVNTPTGKHTILRFDGASALWQTSTAWGTLSGERTVLAFAKVGSESSGVLFDGSTRSASSPATWNGAGWKTAALTGMPPAAGQWQTHSFVFGRDGAGLGGLILGANVATQEGLSCEVAEVLVYPRALSEEECKAAAFYLSSKWGSPAHLPASEQPEENAFIEDPRIFRTTLRKRGADGVHTYRIPGLATTPKGTLIAVFDLRHSHSGDLPADIDVGAMRSTDDGATWAPVQRILDFDSSVAGSHGNGVGDPAVLVDQRTGTIFVAALWSKGPRAWNGSGSGMTPEETGQLVMVKSEDDGLTWSRPLNLTQQVKDPAWRLCFNSPGNGIQLRDGSLVFPAQFKGADNVPRSCFIASIDGGATWKISPAAIPGTPPTSECAVAELADGSLLLTMRNESRGGVRAWARWEWHASLLEGKWSAPWRTLPDPTCMASLVRHPKGVLIFSNPNDASQRVNLTIRSSGDNGNTWSTGRLLAPGGAMYSCLTVLRDGQLGVLYESTAASGLVFARFPLEWVQEGAEDPSLPAERIGTTGKFGWWPARHTAKVAEAGASEAEVVFLGDSITQGWETTGKKQCDALVAHRRALNLGFAGDSTQHVLWRVENGELDGLSPRVIVLLVGTNNVRHGDFTPTQIASGIRTILEALSRKCPRSKVLLLGILPRGADPADPLRRKCEAVNARLPALADGRRVHYLNLNTLLTSPEGHLSKEIAPDLLHLNAKGYSLFAAALGPHLTELLKLP